MSDFFSNLSDATRRVASTIGTEVTVAALEQKVKDAYRILGQLYYKAAVQGQEPGGPAFDAQIETIRRLQREIRQKRLSNQVED